MPNCFDRNKYEEGCGQVSSSRSSGVEISYTAEGPNFTRWHLKLLERPRPFWPDPLLPDERGRVSVVLNVVSVAFKC